MVMRPVGLINGLLCVYQISEYLETNHGKNSKTTTSVILSKPNFKT